MVMIWHKTNPVISVGTLDEFGSVADELLSAANLWSFSIQGKKGRLTYVSAEEAVREANKEFYRRNEFAVRKFLSSEVYAIKQRLRCKLLPVAAPDNHDAMGDWIVSGVFETNEQYSGPLSGLGLTLGVFIDIEGAPLSYRFKALPGHRPLMDEAYEALAQLKNAKTNQVIYQPWTGWIIDALKIDADLVTLESANDSWLNLWFDDHIGEAINPT
jgi:hypothetical protein